MALDATVAGPDANSYVTRDEADAFALQAVSGSDWTGGDDDKKYAALQQSTQMIDAAYDFNGTPWTVTQALSWPRIGAANKNGFLISSDVIPPEIKRATATLARLLLTEDRAADSDIERQGLTDVKAGPIELRFKENVHAQPMPDAVIAMLRHLGAVTSSGFSNAKICRV